MKTALRAAVALFALLVVQSAASAEDVKPTSAAATSAHIEKNGSGIGAGIGAGLTIIGAGLGIGLVGWAALSGIARQPEARGPIQVNMIVMAALVEGVAIISLLVICYALVNKIPSITQ